MKIRKETLRVSIPYIIIALFYLYLMYCVPYTYDDWDWGISNGITQLLTANINSRYVGNFFVVVMTRFQLLKTGIMAVSCFLVPFGIARIAARDTGENREKYQLLYFLLANALILTMDSETWRETYGWVSGFANYVISTLFLLLHLQVLLRVFDEKSAWEKDTGRNALLLGVTSLAGQMFLENLAIYMVMVVFFTGFVYYRKYRKLPKHILCMAAGTVLGLGIMFSSSIYSSLFQTGTAMDGVRLMAVRPENSLLENVKGIALQIAGLARRGGEEQLVLNSVMLGLLACALWKKKNLGRSCKGILCLANGFICCYFCLVHILGISYGDSGMLTALLGAAVNFLFFAVVTVEIAVVLWDNKQALCKTQLMWLSAIAYLAPLAVTHEYGPRIYYIFDVLSILTICMLVKYNAPAANEKLLPCARKVLIVVIAILLAHYGYVYHAIHVCNEERLAIMEQSAAENLQEICLPRFPYGRYLWNPDPENDERMEFFKAFYNVPEHVEVLFE